MALEFPEVKAPGQKYTDPVTNVTYYWDAESNTWVLFSSQSVNKNYVDSRDNLRLRRDGGDFMYGDLTIKPSNSLLVRDNIHLRSSGTAEIAGETTLLFSSHEGAVGHITYGNYGNSKEMLSFDATYIHVGETLNFDGASKTLVRYENKGGETKLVDIQSTLSQGGKYIVNLEDSSSSILLVRGGSNDLFHIGGTGRVVLTSDDDKPFEVKNRDGDSLFGVNSDGSAEVSAEYHANLMDGKVTNDKAVATKAFVESLDVRAGANIIALSEDECQVNGFWTDGNNLYWRIN